MTDLVSTRKVDYQIIPLLPESELKISFVRSSGPGGQNVNKVSTKAVLRWNLMKSTAFSDAEKQRIARHPSLKNRINNAGEVILAEGRRRSQEMNKIVVVERLQRLIEKALAPEPIRRKTKPSRATIQKRLDQKRKDSQKKARRREKPDEG